MNSYIEWQYLGRVDSPENYEYSDYLHGFYNPAFDKMWCFFTNNAHDELCSGEMVDFEKLGHYGYYYTKNAIENAPNEFIGAINDGAEYFHRMLPILREQHNIVNPTSYTKLSMNLENDKELWAF